MTDLVASITAGDVTVAGVLAAEALKSAAAARKRTIDIEVRTAEGVLNPLGRAQITGASALCLIGPGQTDDPRFAGLPLITAALADVLADAGAVLDRIGAATAASSAPVQKKIVAITSCPTGIAHTFMAAEGLQQAAKALGHHIRVETQGSVGAQDTLTDAEIREADVVLIAADTQINLSRFAGKRVFQSGTKPAINAGQALVTRALTEAQPYGTAGGSLADTVAAEKAQRAGARTGVYKHLMTGVSYMIPFVVTGGLLIAIAFALGGIYAFDDSHKGTLAWALFQIGAKSSFALMVPALAGFIAYSIADRPGIAPGMVGGMLASSLGAGFLGGLAAGFIAGYGTDWFNRHIKLHRNLEGLKPVLILPILGSLLTGLLMIYVVGTPVAELLAVLSDWLKSMAGGSAILLGILIGAMMAFDMGGPVNKAAYAFATGLLASQVYTPMAAAMVAGMTPPLGIALATKLFADRFTSDEHEAGNAAAVLGIAFITEGAIPFAARDPFRVIPSLMIGSAVAGALSMAVGAELKVPHGGIFVLPIPNAVTHLGVYTLALIAGTLVTTAMLRILKKPIQDPVS
ncbi:MAG TPA: fructose-specific PTS transporter subunit EIIC [Telmatospirillum sp.]|nr:fructose-specific PTS transporter subunit EIIC [Telmatospirillum sp.]